MEEKRSDSTNGSSRSGTKWPTVSAAPLQQYVVDEGGCDGDVGGGGGIGVGSSVDDGSGDANAARKDAAAAWLATLQGNNNNNNNNDNSCASHVGEHGVETNCMAGAAGQGKGAGRWNCVSCEAVGGGTGGVAASFVEDEGGGESGKQSALELPENTNVAKLMTVQNNGIAGTTIRAADADVAAAAFDVGAAAAAASLSPPPGSASNSNRTSVNNSTENLSYSSDNYYPDDLILLNEVGDGAGDIDGEALSLNSDDCVYAYRGDGADFDGALNAAAGRCGAGIGGAGIVDDETDFLEMDFEPDPLSEIEYGAVEASTPPPHADAFLLQRDSCHLSGRHSATMLTTTATSLAASSSVSRPQRQHFSSPIDELLPLVAPPSKALQAQSLLSKNFARITLHLDQIKGDAERALDGDDLRLGAGSDIGTATPEAAQSLPASFVHSTTPAALSAAPLSPAKVTGAKPKRYAATFSSTSSTSSKNSSSKSRNSLRTGAYAAPVAILTASKGGSCSFDERSVSCSEFRAVTLVDDVGSVGVGGEAIVPLATVSSVAWPNDEDEAVGAACNDNDCSSGNDETCLDCLEREFLANTIGKAHVPDKDCVKCRKKRQSGSASWRCSPSIGIEGGGGAGVGGGSSLLYGDDYRKVRPTSGQWPAALAAIKVKKRLCNTVHTTRRTSPRRDLARFLRDVSNADGGDEGDGEGAGREEQDIIDMLHAASDDDDDDDDASLDGAAGEAAALAAFTLAGAINQRSKAATAAAETTTCDNYSDEMLKLVLTEPEIVRIPSVNLSEETLVQALDTLHIAYNAELLRSHFQQMQAPAVCDVGSPAARDFLNLQHFLLHESKRNCNHPKLRQLIELATRHQVHVRFEEYKESDAETAMVHVRVTDILKEWARHKDLIVLRQLDRRFMEANVLGKIANIVRQSEQQRRPLPEYIAIPQYYPSGCLVLTKKKC